MRDNRQNSIQKVCLGRLFGLFLMALFIGLSACSAVERPDENHGPEVEGFNRGIVDDSPVQVALVVLSGGEGEDGVSLESGGFGCGDSIQSIEKSVSRPLTQPQRIETALNELFAIEESSYGESGLYNALYQSELQVEEVEFGETFVRIELSGRLLSGGACDDPRTVEQIIKTVEFNGPENVGEIMITVNGETLEDYFNASGQ